MTDPLMIKEEKLKAAMEAARLFLDRGELLLAYWRDGGSVARVTISALLHPAYEPGGSEADGAQLVDLEWWQPVMGCDSLQMVVDNARNILSSRWSSPAPMPVAKGDVGGLVAWLLEEAEQAANSDASHSAGMLTWAAQVVGEHAELLQQQQEQVKRLKDELADERMRLSACFRIAICDTPETAPRARDEYREHYWSPAAGAIAQKIDELIRLRKRFFEEAENWRQIAEQLELFYSRREKWSDCDIALYAYPINIKEELDS